jgi:hypothetical protein
MIACGAPKPPGQGVTCGRRGDDATVNHQGVDTIDTLLGHLA